MVLKTGSTVTSHDSDSRTNTIYHIIYSKYIQSRGQKWENSPILQYTKGTMTAMPFSIFAAYTGSFLHFWA